MKYTLQELTNFYNKDVYEIYNIFKDYYKEENVDLQNIPTEKDIGSIVHSCTGASDESLNSYDYTEADLKSIKSIVQAEHHPVIFVHWSEVIVSNEYDQSVKIWDLYAKISLNFNGTLRENFKLCRSTYSEQQFLSHYAHSHLPRLRYNELAQFNSPCLGNGPIYNTSYTLKCQNDPTFWMLFCEELNRYVQTESIKGGPYIRMDEIGVNTASRVPNTFFQCAHIKTEVKPYITTFIPYYIQHGHLKFSFFNKSFTLGMSYYDYMVDISNAFIDFYNSTLCHIVNLRGLTYWTDAFIKVLTKNHRFYDKENNNTSINVKTFVGTPLFDFKGEKIKLQIIESTKASSEKLNEVLLLNPRIAMYILQFILLTVNFKYGRKTITTKEDGETASTYPDALYLFQL